MLFGKRKMRQDDKNQNTQSFKNLGLLGGLLLVLTEK
jgi:hypothetical protein